MTEPTWRATLPAARTVALHATDLGEARELLDMLGLVDDAGRIRPDDTRQYDIEGAQPVKVNPKGAQLWEPPADPSSFTSPPALRVLPPPEKPALAPRRPSPPRKRKPRTVPPEQRKVRKQAQCGTVSGIRRHTRAGEPVCEACKAARREYDRKRTEAKRAEAKPRSLGPVRCGTVGGPSAHKRRGEGVCDVCREAYRAYYRARYAERVSGRGEFERLCDAGVNEASAAILARVENVGEVAS